MSERKATFLGFRIKAANHGTKEKPRHVVESHIKEKALDKISAKMKRLIHDIEFPGHGKRAKHAAVSRFNEYVLGVHDYYDMATMVCHDLSPLAFSVHKSLKARLQQRLLTATQVKKRKLQFTTPDVIRKRYGDSAQLRYVCGYALVPIGYVWHKSPMMKKRVINSYTPEGRDAIHRMLGVGIDTGIMRYLMRNPIACRSAAYNDNCISHFSAQWGKCAVTGYEFANVSEIHCHHILPRSLGGDDSYDNLILVSIAVHRLIHATTPDTIAKYKRILNLDGEQMRKLNKLRKKAGLLPLT